MGAHCPQKTIVCNTNQLICSIHIQMEGFHQILFYFPSPFFHPVERNKRQNYNLPGDVTFVCYTSDSTGMSLVRFSNCVYFFSIPFFSSSRIFPFPAHCKVINADLSFYFFIVLAPPRKKYNNKTTQPRQIKMHRHVTFEKQFPCENRKRT